MSDKVKERIEKDADDFMEVMQVESTATNKLYRSIFISGATAERPKAWNEAIDACLAVVDACPGSFVRYTDWHELLEQLKVLKHKQP